MNLKDMDYILITNDSIYSLKKTQLQSWRIGQWLPLIWEGGL